MIVECFPQGKPLGAILKVVSQFGWIDINEAFKSGIVKGDISSAEISVNGIDDPASIFGKPDDVFAAMRMKSAVDKAAGNSKSSQVTPSGAEVTE